MLIHIKGKEVNISIKDSLIIVDYEGSKGIPVLRLNIFTNISLEPIDISNRNSFIAEYLIKEFSEYKRLPIDDSIDFGSSNSILLSFLEFLKYINRNDKIKELCK